VVLVVAVVFLLLLILLLLIIRLPFIEDVVIIVQAVGLL